MDRHVETTVGAVATTYDDAGGETLLILAHGAGAGMDHPFMARVAEGLVTRGISVLRFDFLYVTKGRRSPDRQAVLESTYAGVARYAHEQLSPDRLFLAGKSMGGRIATHIAASGEVGGIDGLVLLGYPLHPPGRPDRIRDEHLYQLRERVLFVEGTRDPFCPLETLDGVLAKMRAPTDLIVVNDGDHSFKVRKSSGRSSGEALNEAVEAIANWVKSD
ncbi:MAG TPA: alpha/beta fold hydrolase [Actinomycetota bacterium]|nr:alpha/beta fold hydrolase [Actinomycetota bacterium]